MNVVGKLQSFLPSRTTLVAVAGAGICALAVELWALGNDGPLASWASGETGMGILQITGTILLISIFGILAKSWRSLGSAETVRPRAILHVWSVLSVALFALLVASALLLLASGVGHLLSLVG